MTQHIVLRSALVHQRIRADIEIAANLETTRQLRIQIDQWRAAANRE